jgi:cardiolipin synthase
MAYNIMALTFRQNFPWREGNEFQLLVDGGDIFAAMLSSIQAARSQILLEMYLVESGALMNRFIVALIEARQRGVDIYLLFDDFGARGLLERDRQRITQAGMALVTYNPLRYGQWRRNLLRDHRKLMVVDGEVAFIGGIGLTDAFDAITNPESYWHDTAVQARGLVVADWHTVFRRNWRYWAKQALPGFKAPKFKAPEISATEFNATELKTPRPKMQPEVSDARPESVGSGQAGRVAGGRRFGVVGIHHSFLKRVRSAERHVWMMTAYFVPPRGLLRALRRAARRGVDVRLVLPGPITDHPAVRYSGHLHYYSLLRAGVRIFEYRPRFLHAKLLLCDDWVSLGSSNVDRWNLRWNLEANQEVEDNRFAACVGELFETDFAVSDECQLTVWQMRPRYRRVLEWFWGNVAWVLGGIGVYRHRHSSRESRRNADRKE